MKKSCVWNLFSHLSFYLVLILLTLKLNAFSIPPVAYKFDSRQEISQSNPEYQILARSTAAKIDQSDIEDINRPHFKRLRHLTLKQKIFNKTKKKLCDDEKFIDQIAIASCSGFLVGPDLLLTAGHCVKTQKECDENRWVFDYRLSHNKSEYLIHTDHIYKCQKIISREDNFRTKIDYALIKLDRKVNGSTPLKYRQYGHISDHEDLFVIGHPNGLPTKIASDANVTENDYSKTYFRANTDTFDGNSGSAVFNAHTHEVEGILVRGETDFVEDKKNKCLRTKICKNDSDCKGEDIVRMNYVRGLFY